jgi:sterol 3beta-glucosyltransferase
MMKKAISILTLGSRGDVQPFVALGVGLKRAGYEVRLGTDASLEGMCREYGLEFRPLAGDIRAVVESEEGRRLLEKGQNPVALARGLGHLMKDLVRQATPDCVRACEGAELIILGGPVTLLGYSVAEKLGVPMAIGHLLPMARTGAVPSPVMPPPPVPLGAPFNLLTHLLTENVFWQMYRPAIRVAREELLGLPAPGLLPPFQSWRRRNVLGLHGYSPALFPPLSYDASTHVTGYWFLEAPSGWRPPKELVDFLEAGPPPVYVGFGSMSNRDPRAVTDLVLEALERSGQRAVLLSGWGGLGKDALPDTVCLVDSVPHDWLFPRMAAVVHHGGAGTTAAGLRAGVPSVLIPFFSDQPFWGGYVARAGVGPRPIHRKRLTAKKLAEALLATRNSGMRARAAELGQRIRSEDGVARAVEAIERYIAERPRA